jgi:hypothetical protein
MHLSQQHVRGERDKTADGISPGNGQRAPKSAAATGLFQSEFGRVNFGGTDGREENWRSGYERSGKKESGPRGPGRNSRV